MNVNELPQYKCHKVVRAGKILATAHNPNEDAVFLDIDGLDNKWLSVPAGWLSKHNPDIGGYLVAYEDGYLSYSPAEAFEAGYHLLPKIDDVVRQFGIEPSVLSQLADLESAQSGENFAQPPAEASGLKAYTAMDGSVVYAGKIREYSYDEMEDSARIRVEGCNDLLEVPQVRIGFLRIGNVLLKTHDGRFRMMTPLAFYSTYKPFEPDTIDMQAADFSDALMWLKEGRRVARAGWNGKNQFVVLVKLGFYDVGCSTGAKAGALQPFLALKNAQDMFQPGWIPSMGDLMATDWQVVA